MDLDWPTVEGKLILWVTTSQLRFQHSVADQGNAVSAHHIDALAGIMLDYNIVIWRTDGISTGGKWQVRMGEGSVGHDVAFQSKALCHFSDDGWLQGVAPVCGFPCWGAWIFTPHGFHAEGQDIVGCAVGADTKEAWQLRAGQHGVRG